MADGASLAVGLGSDSRRRKTQTRARPRALARCPTGSWSWGRGGPCIAGILIKQSPAMTAGLANQCLVMERGEVIAHSHIAGMEADCVRARVAI